MSFPRYPKYKESGVEWLGQVPEHWDVKRLKRACHVFPSNVDKKSYADETAVLLCNYTDVYYNDTITAGMDFMPATASADQIKKFTLRAGDTIITKDSETADDIAIAAYVPADLPGVVCGYHLSMVRPLEGTIGVFIKWFFDSAYARASFEVLANGLTRVGLGQHELDNVELLIPPAAEQKSIAEFLDQETAKIDALVTEQERLMALLKEKRQAVISHAVTKGLNPKAALKTSGIEWLGDVPAHWSIGALRYFATFSTGSTPSREVERYWNGGIPWVKTGEVNYTTITTTEETITEDGLASCAVSLAPPGTLLMALYGMGVTRGRVALLGIHATFNQACVAIRTDSRLDATFLRAFFIFAYSFIRESGNETTQMNLSAEYVRGIRIPIPPLEEQKNIAAFLDKEIVQFETLTAEAQRAIDLLQERRTALISAAVTGQIDVRKEPT